MLLSMTTVGASAPEAANRSGNGAAPGSPQPGAHPRAAGRRLPVRALIPLILLVGFLIWWFQFRPAPQPKNVIALSGRIEGDDSAVATKPGGRVIAITVREGDAVQRGQLIAMVDDAQVAAREDQARDALQQAAAQVNVQRQQIAVLEQQLEQSRLAVGQAQLDTQGKMFQAQQQVSAADANILQAQARVRSAHRQIAVLQQQLEQSRLAVDQSKLDVQGRVTQAEQQVAAAEANLTQMQAQHHQAEVDARRYALLADEGAVAPQVAEQSRTNEESLRASVTAAQKQAAAARGALTTAQSNLTNPAVRLSQEAAAREQIAEAKADLVAAEAEVKQMKAMQQQAQGNLTAVRANLTNPAVRLSQQSAVQVQIAQAKASLAASQATARQAAAKLAEAKADRSDLRVLAPFSGIVATRVAEPGEVLAPGATVVTMVDLSKVYLRGYIPEGEIGRVKVGQEARIYLDSAPSKPVIAFVSRIDPEASFTPENTYFRNDRVMQVVGVKLQIKEGVGYAKPGMPADGEVLAEGDWPQRSRP
jgi:HlyD family secretion protein